MIYLLRHGQTAWNLERRAQGRCDTPLTALGRRQALAYGAALAGDLAEALGDERSGLRLVTSPLGRARDTARLIAGVLGFDPARIEVEERLIEYSFGDWEGETVERLEQAQPEAWRRYRAERWHLPAPGGECYADVARRVAPWLAEIGEQERVVAVGHGAAGRVIRGLYAGLPAETILALPEPQDRVFRLAGGAIEELPAPLPP